MTDPVRLRRARWSRAARAGQRLGYLLYAIATIAFFVGLLGEFTDAVVQVVEIGLIGGSVLLAPSILVAYMVRAAEKDDLEHGR